MLQLNTLPAGLRSVMNPIIDLMSDTGNVIVIKIKILTLTN